MKNQSLKSSLKITLLLFFCSMILLSLRPVPQPIHSNCNTVFGKVIDLKKAGTKDVVFELSDTKGHFYINRGLESEASLEAWKEKYLNKTIEVSYIKHWSLFSPFHKLKSIARITLDGQIAFDKITD